MRLFVALLSSAVIVAGVVFAATSPSATPTATEVLLTAPPAYQIARSPLAVDSSATVTTNAPVTEATNSTSVSEPASASVPQSSSPASAGASVSARQAPLTAMPRFTDRRVLELSRDVPLPSGRTFSECASLGGESWPTSVHDYWIAGSDEWVVETHAGDVGLLFSEQTERFSMRNVDRRGC